MPAFFFPVCSAAGWNAYQKRISGSSLVILFLLCSLSLSLGLVAKGEVLVTSCVGVGVPQHTQISTTPTTGQVGAAERSLGAADSEEEEGDEEDIMSSEGDLFHVDFEVFGEVQGVFFRKYTQKEGTKLGLRGFCRNTRADTVTGSMEGSRQSIDQMKHWLLHTGSPMSRISNAVFKNEKQIQTFSLPPGFDIARTV